MLYSIKNYSRLTVTAILLLAGAAIGLAFNTNASDTKPVRTVFIDRDVEIPDRNFNMLVRTMEWPVGYKSKPHMHKGPGPRYVLSGKVRIDDQGKIGEYSAGETFWHDGGFEHTAENIADTPTRVLIIELLPRKLN